MFEVSFFNQEGDIVFLKFEEYEDACNAFRRAVKHGCTNVRLLAAEEEQK